MNKNLSIKRMHKIRLYSKKEKKLQANNYENTIYPVIIVKKRRMTHPQKVFLFGCICAVITGISFVILKKGSFSSIFLIVAGMLIGSSVFLLSSLRFKKNQGFYSILASLSLGLIGIVWDQSWGNGLRIGKWIISGCIFLTHIFIITLMIIRRKQFAQFCIYPFSASVLGLAVSIICLCKFTEYWIIYLALAVISIGILIVLFLVDGRAMALELRKRFHL